MSGLFTQKIGFLCCCVAATHQAEKLAGVCALTRMPASIFAGGHA